MFPVTRGIFQWFGWLLLALMLAGCGGGGGSGGFTGTDTLKISFTADKTVLEANSINVGPDPSGPFTNTLTVQIKKNNRIFPAPSVAIDIVSGFPPGALFYLDGDSTHEDKDGNPLAYRRLTFKDTSGTVTAHYHTWQDATGTVVLRASAQDPDTLETITADLTLTVVGTKRPVAALAFTGAYVNAVLAGLSRFGTTDGTYSRTVSVLATDADGNPVSRNTQINFFLIDGPLTGYPGGPGSFFIAGANGNPLEGGYAFDAVGGLFQTKGVRSLDRLVLDGNTALNPQGNPLPDNRFLTGVRVVENVVSQNSLLIQQQGKPFNAGPDNGNTVPYVIGRALSGAILSPAYTDTRGVADTILTYPVFRIGQTAILVACTADSSVCTVLNTCDATGANCKSVYLGATNGSDWILTASATELPANSTTPVRLCLKDQNLAPVPSAQIRYDIGASSTATVTVNGVTGKQGSVTTGADGCVTVTIAVKGQPLGSSDILINFTADNVASPVTITIKGPGAGKLDGVGSCEVTPPTFTVVDGKNVLASPATAKCKVNMQLLDDNFVPQPSVLITANAKPSAGGSVSDLKYDPAQGVYGITDSNGSLVATFTLKGDNKTGGGEFSIEFRVLNGTATMTFTFTLPEIPQ